MLRLTRSFRFAFAGVAHLVRTQQNFRIELALGVAAVGLAAWLRVSPVEWAILALVIAFVLILEGVNTALELTVDIVSPELHPTAKAAKDVAAATVLIASLAALAVAAALFLPHLGAGIGAGPAR